jgi:hypothetical protein
MAITKGGDEFVHTFFKIEDHLISFLEFRGQALVDHFGKGGDHGIVRLIGHVFFFGWWVGKLRGNQRWKGLNEGWVDFRGGMDESFDCKRKLPGLLRCCCWWIKDDLGCKPVGLNWTIQR